MSDQVVKFDNLRKYYDNHEVLKGITTEVRTGDVIGLVGLNGAGKTTLLETPLGFCKPTQGSSWVFGIDSARLSSKETKARIGFVPQTDELLAGISGERYLGLIREFYDHWNSCLIQRLCNEWDVPLARKIHTLSVGQRQKLSIISALGNEPDLLVLDEPVASLDPQARRAFLRELVAIASSRSCTILFSTHIISDLERVASRVWLIKDGALAIDEPLDSLKENTGRVSLPPGVELPGAFQNDDLIHQYQVGNVQTLVFSHWNAERHQALAQAVGFELEREWWLSLEDIFLEVHA